MLGVEWGSLHQTLMDRQHEGKPCAKTTFICNMTLISHRNQSASSYHETQTYGDVNDSNI